MKNKINMLLFGGMIVVLFFCLNIPLCAAENAEDNMHVNYLNFNEDVLDTWSYAENIYVAEYLGHKTTGDRWQGKEGYYALYNARFRVREVFKGKKLIGSVTETQVKRQENKVNESGGVGYEKGALYFIVDGADGDHPKIIDGKIDLEYAKSKAESSKYSPMKITRDANIEPAISWERVYIVENAPLSYYEVVGKISSLNGMNTHSVRNMCVYAILLFFSMILNIFIVRKKGGVIYSNLVALIVIFGGLALYFYYFKTLGFYLKGISFLECLPYMIYPAVVLFLLNLLVSIILNKIYTTVFIKKKEIT